MKYSFYRSILPEVSSNFVTNFLNNPIKIETKEEREIEIELKKEREIIL